MTMAGFSHGRWGFSLRSLCLQTKYSYSPNYLPSLETSRFCFFFFLIITIFFIRFIPLGGCFARISVCVCLVPKEVRGRQEAPGTTVTDGCETLFGC